MYNFVDTIEISEGQSLPSEALKINGSYIEDLIEGYRTLTVEGREALSPELNTYETGIRDGSMLSSKRYPARVIRVTYQLLCASSEAFRAAYNKLAQLLDVQDAQLIFNDEPDKYFTGTPSYIEEVEPGRNAVVAKFEILCLDPFKYSVYEYEAEPDLDNNSILIDYNGTYKSFPVLCAEMQQENESSEDGESVTPLTGNGDCGYVAFFNESEKIIQIGDPDEIDGETAYQPSQTLINNTFDKTTSWGSAAKSQWNMNSGVTIPEPNQINEQHTGTLKIGVASYTTAAPPTSGYKTILTGQSAAEAPTVNYSVAAAYDSRTRNSARVIVSITSWLDNKESYFGRGFVLKGRIKLGGQSKTVVLHASNDYWTGTTKHYNNVIFTVSLSLNASSFSPTFEAFRDDSTGGKTGILAETPCNLINIGAYPVPEPASYYLCADSYGNGSSWHGPSITRAIPVDAAGDTGASNFSLTYAQHMSLGTGNGASNQLGAFRMLMCDADGNMIVGVNIQKGSSGKLAKLTFFVNNGWKESIDVDLSYNNQNFNSGKQSVITKQGESVTFNICGISRTYRDSSIVSTPVTSITFTLSKFGDYTALEHNALYWVKFVKNNCETWHDIPNKFSANDVVEADCKDGKIYLNGVETPSYGALGNDWEDFCLTPGLNQIGFSCSDWTVQKPSFKVRYREVFL